MQGVSGSSPPVPTKKKRSTKRVGRFFLVYRYFCVGICFETLTINREDHFLALSRSFSLYAGVSSKYPHLLYTISAHSKIAEKTAMVSGPCSPTFFQNNFLTSFLQPFAPHTLLPPMVSGLFPCLPFHFVR